MPAPIAVVALGGNAIIRAGQTGTHTEQLENLRGMATAVHSLIDDGWRVVLVHGNGPQVGNLAIQQDAGLPRVPRLPLYLLDAMTQGQLGSLLMMAMHALDPTLPEATTKRAPRRIASSVGCRSLWLSMRVSAAISSP